MPQDRVQYIPMGALMDMSCLGEIEEEELMRSVRIYNNFGNLLLLEADPIVMAKYPKGAALEESVLIHQRYVQDPGAVELLEMRGFRQGRTIDIILPKSIRKNDEYFDLVNIKGVGAFAQQPSEIRQDQWFDGKNQEWVPFEQLMESSLGRRWGALDSYEAAREYGNDLFAGLGLPQVPHLALNAIPEKVFPFSGLSQLQRGLQTNVRCDDFLLLGSDYLQEHFVPPEKLAAIDVQVMETQKRLAENHQLITQPRGRIANNRYIDGSFTDMENYHIETYSEAPKFFRHATAFFIDLVSSAFISMRLWPEGRERYLTALAQGSGFPATDFVATEPEIFLDRLLKPEFYADFKGAYKEFYRSFRPAVEAYVDV